MGAIRSHPLIAFFVLANLLSWLGWTPYILSENGLGVWAFRFPDILGSGQVLGVIPGAFLGPVLSALLVTLIADGRAGLRAWTRRLWHWRAAPRWYAITIFAVPLGLTVMGLVFSGGQIAAPSLTSLALYLPFLALQMIFTGLAEEPGWRDFALPRLQAPFSPLKSAFILGPLWALWHFPLFLSDWGGYPDASWTKPVYFTLLCLGFNIVMVWVFNRTGQSLPLAMLMHVGMNNFLSVLWAEMFPTLSPEISTIAPAVGSVIAGAAIIITTKGRLGYTAPTAIER